MNVFEYRDAAISDYKAFATSCTKIKAPDIRQFVQTNYDDGKLGSQLERRQLMHRT